jgi:tRNA-specific 2-thiouridylase
LLGQHQGVLHYTVGQRRGLGVATGDPLYVVSIDADARQVIVGPKEALARQKIFLSEVNWLGLDADTQELDVRVRIRSTSEPAPARIKLTGEGAAEILLASAEEGVSPGQACVFYETDSPRMLGGGWIASTALD